MGLAMLQRIKASPRAGGACLGIDDDHASREHDESGFRLEHRHFATGEYAPIRERDGESQPWKSNADHPLARSSQPPPQTG